jgi:hypothetical protein
MMPKNYMLKFTGLLLFSMVVFFAHGQNHPKPAPKFKPPVVKTYLGTDTGSGTSITIEEGKKIIGLPLKIVDDKNNIYPVTSYQFAYKRLGVTENDTTGLQSQENDMASARFRDTPLSNVWISTIQDELKSGEELYFFDIVVKDKEGRMFFAPELRLVIL